MKTSASHWADETAAKIIFEKGEKELYICASGITPSGTVHIGNFREIISVELVVRALRDMGKRVRFIYSWDDYDVFRKVPENMPKKDELEKYLRFPITMVPDPWKRDSSYARHHEADIEKVLPIVGITPEYIRQAEQYRSSRYAQGIRKALGKRDVLKKILDKFRDEEHKIQDEWQPVSVFCEKCNKDETEIDNWDGDWGLSYRCNACGNQEKLDIRSAKGIKLVWRVDWPMRWEYEKVDFEPAGKDHHSQGGSFDTARHVCREVYGWDAPVTFRYDFIGIKGLSGKMSSSSGNAITIEDVLKVYTPEVVRYLFAGTRPNTEFTISFDLDVIKIYEDYDKTERIAWKMEAAKDEAVYQKEKRIYELSQVSVDGQPRRFTDRHTEGSEEVPPYQISFRHLCNLIQIADGDTEKALAYLTANSGGPEPEQFPALKERAKCAKYWAENCAPEEFRFRLLPDGGAASLSPEEQAKLRPLSNTEKTAVRILRDDVICKIEEFADDKSCASAIYAAAEKAGIDGKTLFTASYQALIGKEQGPRLANFLRAINKERLLAILKDY
ncbi:MAG: lysine--tRNA ligase [Treponema sp.]|jgi:lysyl-tRNA synthetase class 1|nr:lysine--tRNA ligase [Treponema sp.]